MADAPAGIAPAGASLAAPPYEAPRRWEWLLAAAVSLGCILFGLALLRPQTLDAYDQPLYLGIASDLQQTGIYTNGRWGEAGKPGAYTAPLYPALVAGLAAIDPRLARAAACVRVAEWASIPSCPGSLGLLVPLQVLLLAGTLLLVWRSTLAIGGTRLAAWVALLAAGLGTTEYAVYARTAMTEALSLPLAAFSGLLLVLLVRRVRVATTVALGVVLGLLTLTRPEYLYLTGAIGAAGLVFAVLGHDQLKVSWRSLSSAAGVDGRPSPTMTREGGFPIQPSRPSALITPSVMVGEGRPSTPAGARSTKTRKTPASLGLAMIGACVVAGLVIAPWSLRNERLFSTPAPTSGYAGFILAQRMAYEAMRPDEWAVSWLYALPGFGPAAARIVAPGSVARLGWQDRPDTFYMVGNTTMVQMLAAETPDPSNQVGFLLRRYVWPHPVHFAAVTAVMAWKSLWVRKYFSVVTVPFFFVMVWQAVRRRDRLRLAFVLPPLFVLALHAATTVATPRYSLMLVPAYAAAFGLATGPWLSRRVARR